MGCSSYTAYIAHIAYIALSDLPGEVAMFSRLDSLVGRCAQALVSPLLRDKIALALSAIVTLAAMITTGCLNDGGVGEGRDTPWHRFLYQPLLFTIWSVLFVEKAAGHLNGNNNGYRKTRSCHYFMLENIAAAIIPGLMAWVTFLVFSTKFVLEHLQPLIVNAVDGRTGHCLVVLVHYSIAIAINYGVYRLTPPPRQVESKPKQVILEEPPKNIATLIAA